MILIKSNEYKYGFKYSVYFIRYIVVFQVKVGSNLRLDNLVNCQIQFLIWGFEFLDSYINYESIWKPMANTKVCHRHIIFCNLNPCPFRFIQYLLIHGLFNSYYALICI